MLQFVVLAVLLAVCAGEDNEILKACDMKDLECIRSTTQLFLEKTSGGIPEYNLQPIDPLAVNKLEYELPPLEAKHVLTDLKIRGLKNLEISDFQMDTEKKIVSFAMTFNITNEGHIQATYAMKPESKTVSGTFKTAYVVKARTTYPYDVVKDEKAIEHYEVGKETTTFEVIGKPVYTFSEDFMASIKANPDVVEFRENHKEHIPEAEKLAIGKCVDIIVPTLVGNIRQAAKLYPKSAFFKN